MDIIICIIIASIVTPLLGGALLLTERYLRWCRTNKDFDSCENNMVYVELPVSRKPIVEYPKNRTAFLNKTLIEAATCNCPILCELLIEKGANELDHALEMAIVNGHVNICKIIIRNGACDLEKALSTAKKFGKRHIETFLTEQIAKQQDKKNM